MTKRTVSSNGLKDLTAVDAINNSVHNSDDNEEEEEEVEDPKDDEGEHLKPINSGKDRPRVRMKRQSLVLRRGDTDLSIDHTGVQRFLPQCMHFAFADRDAETLYREYYENEKRSDFKALLVIVLIVNVVLFLLYSLSYSSTHLPQMGVLFMTFALTLIAMVLCLQKNQSTVSSRLWALIPYLLWSVQIAQIFCDVWMFGVPALPSDSIALILLYTYASYVIYPLRLRICCTLAILMAFIHFLFVTFAPDRRQEMFVNQVSPHLSFNTKIIWFSLFLLLLYLFGFCLRFKYLSFNAIFQINFLFSMSIQ